MTNNRCHFNNSRITSITEIGWKPALPQQSKTPHPNLSKAFDTVNHTTLLAEISATNLHHNIVRWLIAYLRGRFTSCRYKDATSVCRAVLVSVPQGSEISPLLFKFLVSQYPQNWKHRQCCRIVDECPNGRQSPLCFCGGCVWMGSGTRATNIWPEIPHDIFHVRYPPIPISTTRQARRYPTAARASPQDIGRDFRPPSNLPPTHRSPKRTNYGAPQNRLGSSRHQLGSARRNYHNDLKSPHMVKTLLRYPSKVPEHLDERRPDAPNCSKWRYEDRC